MAAMNSLALRLVSGRWIVRAILLAGLAPESVAHAQLGWFRKDVAGRPSARSGHQMAFDSARGRTVLFGGRDGQGNLVQDTWEWDGSAWTALFTAVAPGPRESFAMVFDAARGRTVLFGGTDAFGILGDTWEWDGQYWTQRFPAASPSARAGHAMADDSTRQRIVLFGGMNANGFIADTWEWNGTSWLQRTPASSPSPREDHVMAYDSTRRRTVLFGGEAGCVMYTCNWMNDTWEWDGTNWLATSPITSPGVRSKAGLAFDSARGNTILFGGYWVQGGPVFRIFFLGDTWTWNGATWTPVFPQRSPSARAIMPLVFDAANGVGVLFGGADATGTTLSETWTVSSPSDLTAVAPSLGSEAGGDRVQVFGARFTSVADSTVTFGGAASTVLEVLPTRMVVRTPAGTGVVDVAVTNSFGTTTSPSAFTFVSPTIAARFGSVNAGVGERENPLGVNGNVGDLNREMSVPVRHPVSIYMDTVSSRSSSQFVLYAWLFTPDETTLTPMPRGLGAMICPTPFAGSTPQPRAIWNNFGRARVLGSPNFPSSVAPSSVFTRVGGSPRPAVVALQGLIQDDGSITADHVSVTNAIVLRFVP